MTPDQEDKLLLQVQETHQLLVGYPGQKNTGFIERTENTLDHHNKRISRIEEKVLKAGGAIGAIWLAIESYFHWKGH